MKELQEKIAARVELVSKNTKIVTDLIKNGEDFADNEQILKNDAEIAKLDKEILMLKKLDEQNKNSEGIVNKKVNIITSEEKQNNKKVSIMKSVNDYARNGFINSQGAEGEYQAMMREKFNFNGLAIDPNQMRKNSIVASDGTDTGDHVPFDVMPEIDIIAPPVPLRLLGAREHNLDRPIRIPFATAVSSSKLAELQSASAQTRTFSSDYLFPQRHSHKEENVTFEYLIVSSLFGGLLADSMAALERTLSKDTLEAMLNDSRIVKTGFDCSSDASTATTWQTLLKLHDGLEYESFVNGGKYVMSDTFYNSLQGKSVDTGSGRFIIDSPNLLGGKYALGTTLLSADEDKQKIIFGDFAGRLHYAFFGPVEMLLDRSGTNFDTGVITAKFARNMDAAFNPSAFAAMTNLTV